ncbi:MAG: DUF456 domain-containing protein [Chlorobi bacterium]|nr:DUF456 domain-containing protein [Chlorobiota bacterium]
MDIILIIFGILFIVLGILGGILPVLPGPPLSYIGLLLLHFTKRYSFSTNFIILWLAITVIVYLLDYIIPAWGTKKFGGSKRGVWGSIAGLILGLLFFPPFGIIIGPFAGAVIGELSSGKTYNVALRSGLGSFLGLLTGTLLKLIASGMMAWYFFEKLLS